VLFFFFQAEDGIRDFHVTGVQTCALPIFACDSGATAGQRRIRGGRAHVRTALYFAAIAAARFNPGLSGFYRRLRAAGKKPKVARSEERRVGKECRSRGWTEQ